MSLCVVLTSRTLLTLVWCLVVLSIGCERKPINHVLKDSGQTFDQSIEAKSNLSATTLKSFEKNLESIFDNARSILNESSCVSGSGVLDSLFDSCVNQASLKDLSKLSADQKIAALNALVFDTLGLTFDTSRTDMKTIDPLCVIESKRGSCVGLSLIYLLLGRKLNLPLAGVVVPGHFFVRYISGSDSFNIEPMKRGASKSDNWYREKFLVPKGECLYLRDLSDAQVCAVVDYTVGTIFLKNSRLNAAIESFKRSSLVLDNFAEVFGNLALAYDASGWVDSAITIFEHMKGFSCITASVYSNLGTLLLKNKRFLDACNEYSQGLVQFEKDANLWYCLGFTLYSMGRVSEADSSLRQALIIDPNFSKAESLRVILSKVH